MYDRTLRNFDSRIVHRNLARKVVSKEDYKAFMDALEDCSHLAEESKVEFVASGRRDEDEEEAAAEELLEHGARVRRAAAAATPCTTRSAAASARRRRRPPCGGRR